MASSPGRSVTTAGLAAMPTSANSARKALLSTTTPSQQSSRHSTPSHQANHNHQATVSSVSSTDENMNPTRNVTPSQSIRTQIQGQIVQRFEQQLSVLRHIVTSHYRPLKSVLTVRQMSAVFGNIKDLVTVYERVLKHLTVAASKANKDDNSRFEKSLDHFFNGKLGKALEGETVRFTHTYRDACHQALWAQLTEDQKVQPLLQATHNNPHSLTELLDQIPAFVAQYPVLIDQLLLETPLGTMAYMHLEQALGKARDLCRTVTEVRDLPPGHPGSRGHSEVKQSFLAALWRRLVKSS